MRFYDIIAKKRDGHELSSSEINYFIKNYSSGNIPDYQASALLMAIYIQKMSTRETFDLTYAMMNSGDCLNMNAQTISNDKTSKTVDKHSTGGVGDTTTLVLCPLVAACGVPVAKMAGRGLGHTGGTIDKLESIPGFQTDLPPDLFLKQVRELGVAVCSQSANLAPADKLLYGLRDVTATVGDISLATASIMSKKLALGCDAIVLDVKYGNGAFFEALDDALELAKKMVEIGEYAKKRTIAVVTDMNQPLGNAIGNALEVKEAMETLQNNGPEDFTELILALGANMVLLGEKATSYEEAYKLVQSKLEDGSAFHKFKNLLQYQGVKEDIAQGSNKLPIATSIVDIQSANSGYLHTIQSDQVGMSAMILGAGREKKEDIIDLAAGIVLHKKRGDFVNCGDTLATMHTCNENRIQLAKARFLNALTFSDEPVPKNTLVKAIVTKEGVKVMP